MTLNVMESYRRHYDDPLGRKTPNNTGAPRSLKFVTVRDALGVLDFRSAWCQTDADSGKALPRRRKIVLAQVGPHKTTRDWPFEVRPLTPVFGAEILGIDLDQAASPEIFPSIHAAWLRYQVLVFRGLEVSPASQVAFAANFGEVQVHVMNQYQGETDHPELYVLSNLDEGRTPTGSSRPSPRSC